LEIIHFSKEDSIRYQSLKGLRHSCEEFAFTLKNDYENILYKEVEKLIISKEPPRDDDDLDVYLLSLLRVCQVNYDHDVFNEGTPSEYVENLAAQNIEQLIPNPCFYHLPLPIMHRIIFKSKLYENIELQKNLLWDAKAIPKWYYILNIYHLF